MVESVTRSLIGGPGEGLDPAPREQTCPSGSFGWYPELRTGIIPAVVAHIEPAAEQDLAIQVAALGAGDTWTEADWQRFLAERDDPERLYWIDLAVPRLAPAGQLGDLLRDLHSDPLVLDRCLDPDAVSGVFLYEGLLGLQLPVPMDWEASSHPKLTLLCLPSALVTVRVGVLSTASDLAAPGAPVGDRHVKGVGELLAEVLDELVDLTSERVLQARGVVDDLEADLESPARDDGAGNRILHLNRALAHFEMALEAKHRTLTALLAQQSAFVNLDRVRERLRDVVAHVEHSLRYLERM